MAFEINNEKSASNVSENESLKKTHLSYKYSYNNSINLCVNTYLKMVGITKYYLEALQQDLQKKDLTERIHGNTGHTSQLLLKVTITNELEESVKTFITEYAQIHGLPSPLRHRTDSKTFIYLPTSTTYKLIYDNYKTAVLQEQGSDIQILSYTSFLKIWHNLTPHIKFERHGTDLCEVCQQFKAQLILAKRDHEEYLRISGQFDLHKAQADLEREHYNQNIILSKIDNNVTHICYD